MSENVETFNDDGVSYYGLGSKPKKYTIIYEGDGTENRFIPNVPPIGSTVVSITKDGFTIENATDKKVTYKVVVGPFSGMIFSCVQSSMSR